LATVEDIVLGAWGTSYFGNLRTSITGVDTEIKAGEIVASQFGREYRIAAAEVRRYLEAKGFPLPEVLAS
jgi:hypothetical protein